MMPNNGLEFLEFVKTPGEKHIGIATVRLDRRFVFRFKVSPSVNANSIWITKAAYKCGTRQDGKDNYEDAFEFDSSFEKKHIESFVEENVNRILSQVQAQHSAFQAPQQQQAQPAHYSTQQNNSLPFQYPEPENNLPF